MKNIFLLLLTFYGICTQSFGRDPKDSIPTPEFVNQVYQYDKVNNKLVEIERVNAEMKSKIKLMGGGSVVYSIDGARSTARINSEKVNSELCSFMISITGAGSGMSDPSMTMSLYRLDSKKGNREAPMSQYGGSKDKSSSLVEIKFRKLREGVYEIVIAGRLEKGEYGFINMAAMSGGKMVVYAFGID